MANSATSQKQYNLDQNSAMPMPKNAKVKMTPRQTRIQMKIRVDPATDEYFKPLSTGRRGIVLDAFVNQYRRVFDYRLLIQSRFEMRDLTLVLIQILEREPAWVDAIDREILRQVLKKLCKLFFDDYRTHL